MCPRADLHIDIAGTPATMCDCKNLWLKALDGQRGSVVIADDTCGPATTTDELLQQRCQHPDPGSWLMKNTFIHIYQASFMQKQ